MREGRKESPLQNAAMFTLRLNFYKQPNLECSSSLPNLSLKADSEGLVLSNQSGGRYGCIAIAKASGKRPRSKHLSRDQNAAYSLHESLEENIVRVDKVEGVSANDSLDVTVFFTFLSGIREENRALLDSEYVLPINRNLLLHIYAQQQLLHSSSTVLAKDFVNVESVFEACTPPATAPGCLHPDVIKLEVSSPTEDGKLFMYQRQAIHWMLCRERERFDIRESSGGGGGDSEDPELFMSIISAFHKNDPSRRKITIRVKDHPLWVKIMGVGASSDVFFFNPSTGWLVVEDKPAEGEANAYLGPETSFHTVMDGCPGSGLLCDEAGLGKTLEILSLVSANPFCKLGVPTPLPPPPLHLHPSSCRQA